MENTKISNICKTELILGYQLTKQRCEYNLGYIQAASDKGIRENQEDSVIILEHPKDSNIKLLAVADGVGGEQNSELASNETLKELTIFFETTPANYFNDSEYINYALDKKIEEINTDIHNKHIGCTTLSIAIVTKKETLIRNIGDSRVYTYNKGLKQETTDDSYVQRRYEEGSIREKDLMRFHRWSNVIQNAVGSAEDIKINTYTIPNDYEYLILTTDGVTDCLSDSSLESVIRNNKESNLANTIVEQVLHSISFCHEGADYQKEIKGGKDNTTCAVLKRK